TYEEVKTFPHNEVAVSCVAISPDGSQVAAGSPVFTVMGRRQGGGNVRAWDVPSGRETHVFKCEDSVASVLFSGDGKLLLASTLRQGLTGWDLDTRATVKPGVGPSPSQAVRLALVGPRQVLMGGAKGWLRLWDVQDGREVRSFTGHTGGVMS